MLSTLEAEIFVRKTVGELLFEGYEDKIMDVGAALDEGIGDVVLTSLDGFTRSNYPGTTYVLFHTSCML